MIIIRSINLEEIQVLRHLLAAEGYVDLGMFQEAEEELGELDPVWFASERILLLQLRVRTGLNQCE